MHPAMLELERARKVCPSVDAVRAVELEARKKLPPPALECAALRVERGAWSVERGAWSVERDALVGAGKGERHALMRAVDAKMAACP